MSEKQDYSGDKTTPVEAYQDPFGYLENLSDAINSKEFTRFLHNHDSQREHTLIMEDVEIRRSKIPPELKKQRIFPDKLMADDLKATLTETRNQDTSNEVEWVFYTEFKDKKTNYKVEADPTKTVITIDKSNGNTRSFEFPSETSINLLIGIIASLSYTDKELPERLRNDYEDLTVEETLIELIDVLTDFEGQHQLKITTPLIRIDQDMVFRAVTTICQSVVTHNSSTSLQIFKEIDQELTGYEFFRTVYQSIQYDEDTGVYLPMNSVSCLAATQLIPSNISALEANQNNHQKLSAALNPSSIEVIDPYDEPERWEHVISVVDAYLSAAIETKPEPELDDKESEPELD